MPRTFKELQFGCAWRGLRTSAWVGAVCSLMFLAVLASSHRGSQDLGQLSSVLTSDRWSKELGEGILRERYVYTFSTNGAYSACVYSDYGTRPIRGTWKLLEKKGKIHLLLENEEAYFFCLWRESEIRYDKEKDVLIVSGPQYPKEMQLKRVKGKRSENGKHRHPQRCQKHASEPAPAHGLFDESHSLPRNYAPARLS